MHVASDGLFVFDHDRKLVFVSDACRRITGEGPSYELGISCLCHELLDSKDLQDRQLDGVPCPARKIFDGENDRQTQRMSILQSNGHRVWVETTYAAIRDTDGKVSGVVAVMRDISEAIERDKELIGAAPRIRTDAVVACDSKTVNVGRTELPGGSGNLGVLDSKLSMLERAEIVDALQGTHGQRTLAAQRLGISRSRLYRRMEALGIDPRQVGARE